MSQIPHALHAEPSRADALRFFLKSRVLIAGRWWRETTGAPVRRHRVGEEMAACPVVASVRAALWTQDSPAEFPLTAGKIQNLRAACRRLDGIEVPAGEVFSFWKQLGRATRRRGYTEGRELRGGCLVPNVGGGLCQLSGLLHAAAVAAGFEIVERHGHSRSLPGIVLPPERDATVFWNYVDLRFRFRSAWRLEARLTATELVVIVRARAAAGDGGVAPRPMTAGEPVRASVDGDCLTCGVTTCFRHPSATTRHSPAQGHTAWLLDGMWPEFDSWCGRHARPGDAWMTPLDGRRWHKPNYAWTAPDGVEIHHETRETLLRSWRQRRLPAQGAVRQQFLMDAQRRLAERYGRRLDPAARHLVVPLPMLAPLWLAGHLGGRTFDVLMNRWPLAELHTRLDAVAAAHPVSDTLVDYRADPRLVEAETAALAAAARVVTPHRAIAASFGARALLLDWRLPEISSPPGPPAGNKLWFFPASPLARKGIHELAQVLAINGHELGILCRAREGGADPLAGLPHRAVTVADLPRCAGLVIPAWIEHEPRLALRALALGLPVIASRACGLPGHPLLREVDAGDVAGLGAAMDDFSAVSKRLAVK